MEYFNDEGISEEERRSVAFQVWNGVRGALSIAKRQEWALSYERTLDVIHEIDPDLYADLTKLLTAKNESELAKRFKEAAEAESTPESPVTALDLLGLEIQKYDALHKKARSERKKRLQQYIYELHAAKKSLEPRRLSEHRVLSRDVYLAQRPFLIGAPRYESDHYVDYELDENRLLRMRLLHPDGDETITGADLIYEQHDLPLERVRFVYVQYKMWEDNKKKRISLKDERLMKQLDRLESVSCNADFCTANTDAVKNKEFRLPYCSSFLRPTNRLQKPDAKPVTKGYHVPLCIVRELQTHIGALEPDGIAGRSLTNKHFEKMFMANLLGSRWMKQADLEAFYTSIGIEHMHETIRVHAQEVIKRPEDAE